MPKIILGILSSFCTVYFFKKIISSTLRQLYFEILNNTFIIKRLAGITQIKKQDILKVENMDEMHSGILIRAFSSIGGYMGNHWAMNNYAMEPDREFNGKYYHKIKRIITSPRKKIRQKLSGFLPLNLEKFIETLPVSQPILRRNSGTSPSM